MRFCSECGAAVRPGTEVVQKTPRLGDARELSGMIPDSASQRPLSPPRETPFINAADQVSALGAAPYEVQPATEPSRPLLFSSYSLDDLTSLDNSSARKKSKPGVLGAGVAAAVVVALLTALIMWKHIATPSGDVPTSSPTPSSAANPINPDQLNMSPAINPQPGASPSQQPVLSSVPTASPNTATTTSPANVLLPAVKNSPPSIKLTAWSMQITQGEDIEIIADARDADGDALSYAWNASSGELVGDGDRKTLKTLSAKPGPIEIRSEVADGRGLSAAASLIINVLPRPIPPPPPARTVDSMGGTASASKYLSADTTAAVRRREEIQQPGSVSASASIQGDDLVVSLTGKPGNTGASTGTIEVIVGVGESSQVFGHLPAADCRWGFLLGANVKPNSMAFKETAGPYNRFSKIVVRLRPNNNRQPVRFTLTWRLV